MTLELVDRAGLAAELIASLDGEPDTDAEAAWTAEIERRAERARSDRDLGVPWSGVRDRIRGSLREG